MFEREQAKTCGQRPAVPSSVAEALFLLCTQELCVSEQFQRLVLASQCR